METILRILSSPQAQSGIISALIAGVVSLVVALLMTHRSKRAGQAIRAEKLLEVYNPVEEALVQEKKSLYAYVSKNKAVLKKNRPSFSKKILPLIDEAIKEYYEKYRPEIFIGEREPLTSEEKESMEKLEAIEKKLVPILTREIERLRKIAEKG